MKTFYILTLLFVALLAPLHRAAAADTYSLNEKIEVNILGSWDKATVIAIGKGEHEGEYKVHYDGYPASYDRWLRPLYFRKTAGGAPVAEAKTGTKEADASAKPAIEKKEAAVAPRAGSYNIFAYGAVGSPPLFLGHIALQAGGKYRISRKKSGDYYGEGTWSFDAASSTIQWLSGPCKDDKWGGTFTSERDDKTHKIRLTRTTIATNTTD